MSLLAGRRAIVTGAANGIGLAVTRQLLACGVSVLMVDHDERALDAFFAGSSTSKVVPCVADVSTETGNGHIADTIRALWGAVDIAVLNAGISGTVGRIDELAVAEFDRVMAVNVRGVWLGLSMVIPIMREAGGGSVVATASTGGLRGSAGLAAYAASKHAVIGLVKSAAAENARHNIRINAICPAPIDTTMIQSIAEGHAPGRAETIHARSRGRIPLGRYGTPDEAANLALFLAGDAASFMTGGAYLVDGGMMA